MGAFSVVQALDDYVAELEEPRLPDGMWHPSGIFGCPRQTLYKFHGIPESDPADARAKRVFRVGHILHEFVQAAVARSTDLAAYYAEVKIEDPIRRIKGSVDGLKRFVSGGWEVDEYKTINSNAFRFKDLPKEDHRGQASVYMQTLREFGGIATDLATGQSVAIPPLGDSLTRARLIYLSKDDLKVEEHTVLWTPGKAELIEDRLELLEDHLADGTLPSRLPDEPVKERGKLTGKTKRAYLCGYCPFATRCWDEDPAEGPLEVPRQ